MADDSDGEVAWVPDGHAVTEEFRLMYYRRFAALFLSDAGAYAKAREGGKRWIMEEPDCCWAQHWWRLFEAGVEALAAAISADTAAGRHLRTTPPAWLMPYPAPVLDVRRAEWQAAKSWLLEQHSGSLRDPFDRWQELIEIAKAEMAMVGTLARAEVLVAPALPLHVDTPAAGSSDGTIKPV